MIFEDHGHWQLYLPGHWGTTITFPTTMDWVEDATTDLFRDALQQRADEQEPTRDFKSVSQWHTQAVSAQQLQPENPAKPDPNRCEDCQERTRRNERGDLFNPTADPEPAATITSKAAPATAAGMDMSPQHGLEQVSECTTSFQRVKTYFSVQVMRCRRCDGIWLLGYYEDFDAVPIEAEWGLRRWTWRPLTSEHVAQIEAATGQGTLDLDTFAAAP